MIGVTIGPVRIGGGGAIVGGSRRGHVGLVVTAGGMAALAVVALLTLVTVVSCAVGVGATAGASVRARGGVGGWS